MQLYAAGLARFCSQSPSLRQYLIQIAQLGVDRGGHLQEVPLVRRRAAAAVVRTRHHEVHQILVLREASASEDDALARSERLHHRGRFWSGFRRTSSRDGNLDADDFAGIVENQPLSAMLQQDRQTICLRPSLIAGNEQSAAALVPVLIERAKRAAFLGRLRRTAPDSRH